MNLTLPSNRSNRPNGPSGSNRPYWSRAGVFSTRSVVLFCLALAVFTWGLQYKLSRYYPAHTIERKIPKAKLLTGKELTAGLRSLAKIGRNSPVQPKQLHSMAALAWVPLDGGVKPNVARADHRRNLRRLLWRQAFFKANFFRPPPLG